MHCVVSPPVVEYSTLFEVRPSSAFVVAYRETGLENLDSILEVYKKLDLSEKIISIYQPTNSPEINSQNFRLTLQSGKQVLLRRCRRLQGQAKYEAVYKLLNLLRKEGINVPEFYSLSTDDKVPYFEVEHLDGRVCWVFFKCLEADRYYSGRRNELIEAAEQIGKMHACLKKYYNTEEAVPTEADQRESHLGPFLKREEWNNILRIIEKRIENGGDQYDHTFLENKGVIEEAINFVENHYSLLEDQDDIQNIHFDLNSRNFLVDKDQHVTIMDFDEVKLGNVYTDIGFAFHRLLTTCLEQREENIRDAIQMFLTAYQKGNPTLKLDWKKMIVATYNRTLRNIKANLVLKYIENKKEWMDSISLNLNRLKQVMFLAKFVEELNK